MISSLINAFRVVKNFSKFKNLIIRFNKSYCKNLNTIYSKLNILLPSVLFINSIQSKFTIFKNHIYQFKNKSYDKNLNRNIRF